MYNTTNHYKHFQKNYLLENILNLKRIDWNHISKTKFLINPDQRINEPELIFRKIEDEEIEKQLNKLKGSD